MTDFNFLALQSLRREGFHFLHCKNMVNFMLITPLFEEQQPDEGPYVMPINDLQADEMACGEPDFEFYLIL